MSFLGRARQDPKTGYREATYRFPDGQERTTAFFGVARREVLAPDKLLLLGTSGSMWDFLVEHLATEGQEEELLLRLIEAATDECVDPELLVEVTALVERALGLPRRSAPRNTAQSADGCVTPLRGVTSASHPSARGGNAHA